MAKSQTEKRELRMLALATGYTIKNYKVAVNSLKVAIKN
jgi:hypothetical protein